MDILKDFLKYLKTNHLWVKLKYGNNQDFDPKDISDPIVEAIQKKKDNPKEISQPIVDKLGEVSEVIKDIKFPEAKEKMKVELEGVSIVAIKGDKGDKPIPGKDYPIPKDGKTPEKGKDYFTSKEQKEFLKKSTPVKNIDYFDGADGYCPVKNKDYFDGKDGKTPVKDVDFFDGKNGEDGSPDKPKDIKKKLETLKGLERLDAKAIKNLPFGGGGGVQDFYKLRDVPTNYNGQAGKLLRVKADSNGLEFVSPQSIEDVDWGEINGLLSNQTDLQSALTDLEIKSIAYSLALS